MTDPAKKKAYIIRTFKDAGTDKTFAAGAIEQIDAGAFGNYEACGFVRAATAEDGKVTAPKTPA